MRTGTAILLVVLSVMANVGCRSGYRCDAACQTAQPFAATAAAAESICPSGVCPLRDAESSLSTVPRVPPNTYHIDDSI